MINLHPEERLAGAVAGQGVVEAEEDLRIGNDLRAVEERLDAAHLAHDALQVAEDFTRHAVALDHRRVPPLRAGAEALPVEPEDGARTVSQRLEGPEAPHGRVEAAGGGVAGTELVFQRQVLPRRGEAAEAV